jgi:predicted ATP-grasp superfamily ATP-dependent carboligase
VRYHGVFGIEWIRDRETGEVFVIDFNARAFSSIGHLTSCGVNLPLLAVLDLLERELPAELLSAETAHQTWADMAADAGSVYRRHGALAPGAWSRWCWQMLRCRSYALWSPSDPGPFAGKLRELVKEKTPWTSS